MSLLGKKENKKKNNFVIKVEKNLARVPQASHQPAVFVHTGRNFEEMHLLLQRREDRWRREGGKEYAQESNYPEIRRNGKLQLLSESYK